MFQNLLSSWVYINRTSEVWKGMLFPKELIHLTHLFVLWLVFCFIFVSWQNFNLFHSNTGMFICDYTSSSSKNIIHRASAYLDVPLLPQIFITSEPQFPNCQNVNMVHVTIKCIIENSTENYSVNWLTEDSQLKKASSTGGSFYTMPVQMVLYSIHKTVF